MARLTREESRARTRELLFASALKLVAEKGYDGVTVTDIAETAGFSKGAFFANFDSKESMLFELLCRNFEAEYAVLRQVLASMENGASLSAHIDDYFNMLDENLVFISYNMQMLQYANRTPTFAPSYFALFSDFRSSLGKMISMAFEELKLQPLLTPQEMADQLIAMSHGLMLQKRASVAAPLKNLVLCFFNMAQPLSSSEHP